jgi:hypothetical protein
MRQFTNSYLRNQVRTAASQMPDLDPVPFIADALHDRTQMLRPEHGQDPLP